jgi:dihydrofolate reductase
MIRHIVAIDSKRGIAKDGVQPWKLPADERYFTEQTKRFGGVVLMGRKTFEVIGKPLPDRQNFVLTHDKTFDVVGVTRVDDLDEFFDEHPDVWVIGGAEVYELTLKRADELYVTEIAHDFSCDTFYPPYDEFELSEKGIPLTENSLTYSFNIYKPAIT